MSRKKKVRETAAPRSGHLVEVPGVVVHVMQLARGHDHLVEAEI